ncbi:hypothetical protein CsSME_00024752 [Camellia sinensis var. sinensis]
MNQSDANAGYIMGQEHKFFVKESNTSPCDSNQAALAVSERPHNISYAHAQDKTPKEIIVSRKCAEAVLRGAQVYMFLVYWLVVLTLRKGMQLQYQLMWSSLDRMVDGALV